MDVVGAPEIWMEITGGARFGFCVDFLNLIFCPSDEGFDLGGGRRFAERWEQGLSAFEADDPGGELAVGRERGTGSRVENVGVVLQTIGSPGGAATHDGGCLMSGVKKSRQ